MKASKTPYWLSQKDIKEGAPPSGGLPHNTRGIVLNLSPTTSCVYLPYMNRYVYLRNFDLEIATELPHVTTVTKPPTRWERLVMAESLFGGI